MRFLITLVLLAFTTFPFAHPVETVLPQARANKEPLLATLKELVSIESGSRDAEGLAKLADLIAAKLEASRVESDKLSLATAGIASVTLKVQGRASHAGAAPERGINALYELSHQILQTRDLSDPATGLKMNWTVSQAGITRNMIPPAAQAMADVRVLRVAEGGGTDAAFAALKTQNAVVERS